MRKIFILLSFIVVSILHGQNYTPKDSLEFLLKNDKEDTNKVNHLKELIDVIYLVDPKLAMNYSQQMTVLSETLNYKNGIANGYSWQAYFNQILGNVDFSIKNYFDAIKIYEELGSLNDIAICYNNIAVIYRNHGKTELALKFYFKSLEMEVEEGDSNMIANSINNIGIVYLKQEKINEAIGCFRTGLQINKLLGNQRGIAKSLENFAAIFLNQEQYMDAYFCYSKALNIYIQINDKIRVAFVLYRLGDLFEIQSNDKVAIKYYHKSVKIATEIGDKSGLAFASLGMGKIYFGKKNWYAAMEFYQDALTNLTEIKHKEGMERANYLLGQLYLEWKNPKLAIKYLSESYRLSEELGFPKSIRNSARLLYKLYKQNGQLDKAFTIHERYVLMKDSVEHNEGRKLLALQKSQFESEQENFLRAQADKEEMERRIAKITRSNNLQHMGMLFFILAVFGFTLSMQLMKTSPVVARGFIFVSLLILFEFLLVLTDPYIDRITNGVPIYKLLVNTILATLIFPIHSFLERRLRKKVKSIKE